MAAILITAIVGVLSTSSINSGGNSKAHLVFAQQANTTILPPLTKPLTQAGQKEFYVFSALIPNVQKSMKVEGDVYSLPTIPVNKGDKVTVHFYNVDPHKNERHSFTIGAPYNIDKDIMSGDSAVATFTADKAGIFQYYCKYHIPQMTGQLIVLEHA
jgi:nitrous oxide reductase